MTSHPCHVLSPAQIVWSYWNNIPKIRLFCVSSFHPARSIHTNIVWPVTYWYFIFNAAIRLNLIHKIFFCLWERMKVPSCSPSFSLRQKQLCARELCTRWKDFNKVVLLLLVLPFLSLPHFTNVWMPLMRNQDHSRGAQWTEAVIICCSDVGWPLKWELALTGTVSVWARACGSAIQLSLQSH